MCGIAGIYRFDSAKVSREDLKRMTDEIAHRGPDGEGFWISEDLNIGFGHRRLAILDLDKRSDQPFRFKNLVLTYNGEIYNYLELKEELETMGYEFKTSSDTEVLIKSYDAWGKDCLSRLDGMFAFSVYDVKKKELFAARDR